MKRKILNKESHKGSSEEETEGVLETERKLILSTSTVHFNVSEDVKNVGEEELVEEGDGHHGEQGSSQTHSLQIGDMLSIFSVLGLMHGLLHCRTLRL